MSGSVKEAQRCLRDPSPGGARSPSASARAAEIRFKANFFFRDSYKFAEGTDRNTLSRDGLTSDNALFTPSDIENSFHATRDLGRVIGPNHENRVRNSRNGGNILDSFPEVSFEIDQLLSTVDDSESDWQLLLRITADFSIRIGGRTFYKESDFPVVEFSYLASHWLNGSKRDFEYESMESDVGPLIEFRRGNDGTFLLHSQYQEFVLSNSINEGILFEALNYFFKFTKNAVGENYGFNLAHLF